MAAGLGFKTFTTGEVLTAADVNGYLMQGILVFASEAARNSAITSPQEGQFAFTKDNNSLWYYTGSAWVASGATGDIEGITAGVGISGGGTSGTVTITNSMATAIDAKGDLVPGTGADTFSRLAVGANGTVLTADSAESTGMKWASAAAPAFSGALAYNNASTTVANNSEAFFTYNSEVYDTDGYHSTSSNTGRLTIPTGKSGYYLVYSLARFAANANGVRTMQITQGASQTSIAVIEQTPGGVSSNTGFYAATIRYAAAADYFETKIYQTSGGNLDVLGGDNQNYMGIQFLGA